MTGGRGPAADESEPPEPPPLTGRSRKVTPGTGAGVPPAGRSGRGETVAKKRLLPSVAAVLTLLPAALGVAGAALAQAAGTGTGTGPTGVATPVPPLPPGATSQASPRATDPIPAQGPGQAPFGAAVTGSAPGPGVAGTASPGPPAPSPIDSSQDQQGTLLKPGPRAGDMDAAAGAKQTAPAPSPQ